MESIKSKLFGKNQIGKKEMKAIHGGFAQTKTKGRKTKEAAGDKDSASSQENPQQQIVHEQAVLSVTNNELELSGDSFLNISDLQL